MLEPLAGAMYANLGSRRIGVTELVSVERNDLAETEDKEPYVKLRIAFLEVASEEQEDTLRQALRALKLQRTATGTLTEDGDVELSAGTLERCADSLHAHELSRLRVGVEHWVDYLRNARFVASPSVSSLRSDLDNTLKGLQHLLHGHGGGMLPLDGQAGSGE